MSKITIDRAVVERAMEALEWHYRQGHSNTLGGFRLKIDEKALRELSAALAQQGEPVEPAYKVEIAGRWHDTEPLAPAFSLPDGEHLLYTAPPQRKPLTEEEIGRFCDEVYWSPRQLVRAVERAHGIKE